MLSKNTGRRYKNKKNKVKRLAKNYDWKDDASDAAQSNTKEGKEGDTDADLQGGNDADDPPNITDYNSHDDDEDNVSHEGSDAQSVKSSDDDEMTPEKQETHDAVSDKYQSKSASKTNKEGNSVKNKDCLDLGSTGMTSRASRSGKGNPATVVARIDSSKHSDEDDDDDDGNDDDDDQDVSSQDGSEGESAEESSEEEMAAPKKRKLCDDANSALKKNKNTGAKSKKGDNLGTPVKVGVHGSSKPSPATPSKKLCDEEQTSSSKQSTTNLPESKVKTASKKRVIQPDVVQEIGGLLIRYVSNGNANNSAVCGDILNLGDSSDEESEPVKLNPFFVRAGDCEPEDDADNELVSTDNVKRSKNEDSSGEREDVFPKRGGFSRGGRGGRGDQRGSTRGFSRGGGGGRGGNRGGDGRENGRQDRGRGQISRGRGQGSRGRGSNPGKFPPTGPPAVEGKVHPSWEASMKRKEQMRVVVPQGKKTVFSDD